MDMMDTCSSCLPSASVLLLCRQVESRLPKVIRYFLFLRIEFLGVTGAY